MTPKATAATGGHRYAYRFGHREPHHPLLLGIKNKQTRKQKNSCNGGPCSMVQGNNQLSGRDKLQNEKFPPGGAARLLLKALYTSVSEKNSTGQL